MAKIHQLSTTLSNQIAAGEVIERPASVVKELVENALDAHATQVDVQVEEAGVKLISVLDNGDGIEADDVPTAFLRHATSKILTTKDLFNVGSLGFRGEALASIAAVAAVTLETATEDGIGTVAEVTGGEFLGQHSQAVKRGTQVTVRDLFFNTPARLKYLKAQATELAKIVDIINRLALAHPNVAFSLRHGGTMVLKTAGQGDLQQTIAGIYGVGMAKQMLAFSASDLDFKVSGYLSLPDTTRAARTYISLFINGRYIKNFALTKALIAGYGSKLMVGRYPVAVVNVTMDPLLVDVNVHPTKQEVRLSKESQLGELLQAAVTKRLRTENLIPDAVHNLKRAQGLDYDQLAMQLQEAQQPPVRSVNPVAPVSSPVAEPAQGASAKPADFGLPFEALPQTSIFDQPERLAQWDAKYAHKQPDLPEPAVVTEAEQSLLRQAEAARAASPRFPELRYLAQLHGTYLLAEGPDGFYILDQHAAQERVNYEYYRQKIGEVAADQQRLLVPIVLDYPASDALVLQAHREVLESVGVYLEDFGQNSFVVHQHPTWFKAGQEEDTLREMIDWVLSDHRVSVAAFREKTAIMMSCKRAIKANHHLDEAQAKALVVKLAQAENPFNCPHGRPVLIHFSGTDLEKMFKRIQDSHESERSQ